MIANFNEIITMIVAQHIHWAARERVKIGYYIHLSNSKILTMLSKSDNHSTSIIISYVDKRRQYPEVLTLKFANIFDHFQHNKTCCLKWNIIKKWENFDTL